MYIKMLSILLFFWLPALLPAQDFSGTWTGVLTQNDKPDRYIYEVRLEQYGHKVNGVATSRSEDGGQEASFEMGGIWNGETLTLQEVKQLKPENARWCLKHIRLKLTETADGRLLEGSWEAKGCTPGKISLRAVGHTIPAVPDAGADLTAGQPSNFSGKYTGTLSQSDREYGFYFEMQFNDDGTGISNIISDGEGGNATHSFTWSFDPVDQILHYRESEVSEKSVASWPWCIKSAKLLFEEDENRRVLTGEWMGHIEGFSLQSGACAPGRLYVEQPIFRKEDLVVSKTEDEPVAIVPSGVQPYEKKTSREVTVDRVLEVRNNTIKVRVWDNGTVDGDVLSLFVNGEMILENYRVTRRKHETIIALDQPVNYLILHAINLGSISPNTVAVSVDDGIEEQVIIMSSNLDKSGAVMIRQFQVGN